MPDLTTWATLKARQGDPSCLRNGLERTVGSEDNGWRGKPGDWVTYAFDEPELVRQMRFIFDSNLNRPEHNSHANYRLHIEPVGVPETMVKAFRVEYLTAKGEWETLITVEDNYQRLVRLDVDVVTRALRFIPESTWGADDVHVSAWDVSD